MRSDTKQPGRTDLTPQRYFVPPDATVESYNAGILSVHSHSSESQPSLFPMLSPAPPQNSRGWLKPFNPLVMQPHERENRNQLFALLLEPIRPPIIIL